MPRGGGEAVDTMPLPLPRDPFERTSPPAPLRQWTKTTRMTTMTAREGVGVGWGGLRRRRAASEQALSAGAQREGAGVAAVAAVCRVGWFLPPLRLLDPARRSRARTRTRAKTTAPTRTAPRTQMATKPMQTTMAPPRRPLGAHWRGLVVVRVGRPSLYSASTAQKGATQRLTTQVPPVRSQREPQRMAARSHLTRTTRALCSTAGTATLLLSLSTRLPEVSASALPSLSLPLFLPGAASADTRVLDSRPLLRLMGDTQPLAGCAAAGLGMVAASEAVVPRAAQEMPRTTSRVLLQLQCRAPMPFSRRLM